MLFFVIPACERGSISPPTLMIAQTRELLLQDDGPPIKSGVTAKNYLSRTKTLVLTVFLPG